MERNVRLVGSIPERAAVRAGRSFVAVIGIDQYQSWPRLKNAVSDATAAARLFQQLGFAEVTPPLLDAAATAEAMRRLVTTDLASLTADDSLVVFYAGHGHTHTAVFDDVSVKTGYVIPVDAASPGDAEGASWLRLDNWLSDIARLPPRHILVIVDACHSGVALSPSHKWRDAPGRSLDDLEALRKRRSRRVITSALDDQRAMDGGPHEGHSLFTGCLIEGLSGGLARDRGAVATGMEIGQYVQRRVMSYPHTSQTPDFGAFELDDRGEIIVPILGGAALADPGPLQPSLPGARSGMRTRWKAIVAGAIGIAAVAVGSVAVVRLTPVASVAPVAPVGLAAAFDVPAVEVPGAVFEPHALRVPWVPAIEVPERGYGWLAKQRERVKHAKSQTRKHAETVVLAAMLYGEAGSAVRAGGTELLNEARGSLRDSVQASPGTADEIAWRLLGAFDVSVDDHPAAEKTWRALIEAYPESADRPYYRAWLAYALLKQHKDAAALTVVATGELDAKQPELAYVTAWARWRNKDTSGAWLAIMSAAMTWSAVALRCKESGQCIFNTDYTIQGQLERDLLLFAGHAGIAPEHAAAALKASRAGTDYEKYTVYARLGIDGYGAAGSWAYGIAALDEATRSSNGRVKLTDNVAIRDAQTGFAIRLDAPDVVAKYATLTIDALAICAVCDANYNANIVQQLYAIGRLFRRIHETTHDRRYYQPAYDLYTMTSPLLGNAATRAQAQRELSSLEAAHAQVGGSGSHDPEVVGELLHLHDEEVAACYQLRLAGDPTLAGVITLDLAFDAAGAIEAITPEPPPGSTALAAVANCVAAQARQWRLPRRGMAGSTHVRVHYTLAVKTSPE